MKKMNSLCPVSNRVFKNKFQEHVNDHGDEGIGAHAVLVRSLKCQKSESRSEDDSRLLRVSEDQVVERSLDMSCKEVATFAVKPRSSRNLIAQKWRCKSAQLDCESRKACDVAKSDEIPSWLRCEAVIADSIGYNDPRVGSEVPTEALVASRRGRSLCFLAAAQSVLH